MSAVPSKKEDELTNLTHYNATVYGIGYRRENVRFIIETRCFGYVGITLEAFIVVGG
ncbi:hypothetical protein QA601_16665 [Chitinispirillales bacterium ANBcel5]|uniref:hypothetical protein n=1 Tax=Cellulosispirillum alkaliphilum TaxID=3039283 RepID=UPI002A52E405|nr:hypothetical protein [Chitinispirillales bacterium ANBcel5]